MHVSTHGRRRVAALAVTLVITLAITLGLSGPAHALNPEIRLNDYNHASWATRDGAPAEIKNMAQTPDGWLWLSTATGLYRFDGVRFEHVELPRVAEVARRRMSELRATANGDLWISYSVGGLSVLRKGGKLEDVAPLDGPIGVVMNLAEDKDGSAWIAGGAGLFLYAGGQLRKLGPEQGLPAHDVRSVLLDQYGQLWALYVGGLYRLDRASGRFALMQAQRDEGQLIQSPDGRLWIADARQVQAVPLEKFLPRGQRLQPRAARFNSAESRVLAQFDRDGNLWTLSCPQALCLVAGAARQTGSAVAPARDATDTASPQLGITPGSTNAVLEDMEGNIWIATQTGLQRFRENLLIPVRLPFASGLFSMGEDSASGVWLSDTINDATWQLTPKGVAIRSPRNYQAFTQGRDGALLMAGRSEIERRQNGAVSHIPLPPNKDGKADYDIAGLVDDGKVLWMASRQSGLIGYLDGRWQPRSAFSLPPRIFIGTSGRKPGERWHATGDGTVVFNDNGKLTTYDAGGIGLPTLISAGEDILAAGDLGLAVLLEGRFRKLTAVRPDALNNISGIAVSAEGDRWFNSNQGVLRVRRADWLAAMAHPEAPLQYQLIGALDGYIGQAMLRNRLPSVFADKSGQIWFMTSAGVLRVSPGEMRRNTIAPVPQVLRVEAQDIVYEARHGLRLPPGAQNFSVQFTAPALGKPEAMRFQYQLSGVNDDWQEAGNRRIAYYTNVAPGSYSFRVRAFNQDGVMSAEEARLDFEIEPRFVQTIWFKALCGLALAALLYLLYLYRMRVATRRVAARMTVRMAERERIARTLHDTFLQSVQALILRLDVVSAGLPEDARSKLEPILDQANDTIVEGRDQVYELRTGRVDDVESATEEAGRQLRNEHPATSFGFAVAGARRKLRDTVAEEACEIAREALRNAFHHAAADRVEALVIYDREHFTLQISDDGKGLAPDAESKQKHYGLTGMRERAVRAGGKLEIGAAPGGGVRVVLNVPARTAYIDSKRWWRR
ncbi:Histidine kinase-, DNA gyrase B-, and HSP90-like ATPase [Duganella sp. CF402]|uniref:sensor histidine kinase n=1 Tax=unclassified Duganella TaxID=2636909 RepID=UPI0008AD1208|nr:MULTISPECIES: sensor histidine kinase [unclassified Duganella]RZT10327.1 histidine kinase [Duganella sp. BK701]SEL18294.1 Histidine kinase-, DNA gyrase B-, and HSP90-like ATPase [Duganella sp. CF402]